MNFAPTAGPIGLQIHTHNARMVNRHGSALAIGDVVQLSWEHTGADTFFTSAITSDADLRKSPLASVIKIDAVTGDDTMAPTWIGVVSDLGSYNGADGTEVTVTFGSIISCKVKAITNAIAYGGALFAGDSTISPSTAGLLSNAAGSTDPDTTVAYALGAVSAGATTIIPVLMLPQPILI